MSVWVSSHDLAVTPGKIIYRSNYYEVADENYWLPANSHCVVYAGEFGEDQNRHLTLHTEPVNTWMIFYHAPLSQMFVSASVGRAGQEEPPTTEKNVPKLY